jgi:hypothetical protein
MPKGANWLTSQIQRLWRRSGARKSIDWKYEIASTFTVQNEIARLDTDQLYNFTLPKVAASPEAVRACQQVLGFEFDDDFADFLNYADGWDSLAVGDGDLFGTQDYKGSDRFIETQKFLKEHADDGGLDIIQVSFDDVFPICMSRFAIDLYVMRKRHIPGTSRVYWFAGYLVDEFPSFLAYNLSRLEEMKTGGQSTKLREILGSTIRSAGDLGGFFEINDKSSYFYLCKVAPTGEPTILKSVRIELSHKGNKADQIEITWTPDEKIMSLRLNNKIIAAYDCDKLEILFGG